MQRLNNKGFLLADSLITVLITSIVCVTCYSIYQSMVNYEEGYMKYQEESNEKLIYIYGSLPECEECQIDEPD